MAGNEKQDARPSKGNCRLVNVHDQHCPGGAMQPASAVQNYST